ncbi:MAG: hypothetical protein HHAS10_06580 [Candidatus Altimarinota bacterium]
MKHQNHCHETINDISEKGTKRNATKGGSHSYFQRNKRKILGIIASGIISGCGGGNIETTNNAGSEVSDGKMQKMAVSIPISSVPTWAPFEVDGMMGYGYIYFEHPISGYVQGPYMNPFQSSSYNPKDVLTRLGSTEWVIVRASFTYDVDKNNDGKTDSSWTPINAGMSMIIHRSVFERGEKIIFSPRSAFISESILTRSGKILSKESLDTIARESSTDDMNNDGIIDYSDITGKKWSAQLNPSISLPGFGNYMESVYVNNGVNRGNAIKTLIKMQNHTILKIVPQSTSHDPALKIETSSTSSILYTLDGSTPIPGGPTTLTGASGITIPLQDRHIYFREYIPTGTTPILGKVKSFDLATDWMELTQQSQKYNPSGKETLEETSHSYNGKNYIVRAISNKTSPGYTYPKFLDCQLEINTSEGCHLGPYVAYNEAHEAKVRELIHSAIQEYINTQLNQPTNPNPPNNTTGPNTSPNHYQNEIVDYTAKTPYLGGWYQVQVQWNLTGKNDFPVTIVGSYATPDGIRQANITATANSEAERLSFSQSMVGKLKSIIDASNANLPKPTYPPNTVLPSNPVSYKGYTYTLITTMNTTGYSDYPASVKVKYTTPNGAKETPTLPAKNISELSVVQNERINEAKSQIDMSLGLDKYPPYYVETITSNKPFGYGSYTTTFTYSGTLGKDYPGYIDVNYRRLNGTTGKWTMEAKSEAEKNLFIPQGEAQARLEIDNYPLHPVNNIVASGNIPYGNKGGTYTQYEKYNRKGTGYNYPVLIWMEYRSTSTSQLLDSRNTYGVVEAQDSEQLKVIRGALESWVKGQITALGPTNQTTKYANSTGLRIFDILIPSAFAANTPNSIIIKSNPTKLTPLSPYSADISFFRTYNIGNPTQEFFMKPGFSAPTGKSRVNYVGRSIDEARIKAARNKILTAMDSIIKSLKTIEFNSLGSCSGAGTVSTTGGCIKNIVPGNNTLIEGHIEILKILNDSFENKTLDNQTAIEFVIEIFNGKGLIFESLSENKLGEYHPALNAYFAYVVGSGRYGNLKRNRELPIVDYRSGSQVIRGIVINGVIVSGTELGNLLIGYLGAKAGFTFDYIKTCARVFNMWKYIEENKGRADISEGELLGHAWNLAGINEAGDSVLYREGYNYAIANPNKTISSNDILNMFKSQYDEYKKISDPESSLINLYKQRFNLN